MQSNKDTLLSQRGLLLESLKSLAHLGLGTPIGAQDANFILIPVLEKNSGRDGQPDNARAHRVYKTMGEEGVVVRYRGFETGCAGCLRITVGSEDDNKALIEKLGNVLDRL
jgi:histidinol-phosphate aminotransferase